MQLEEWPEIQELLPPLSTQELVALRRSIRKNGVRQELLVFPDGRVIDGHHRLAVCRELKIVPPHKVADDLTEEQAIALGVILNWARRQMSREQWDEYRQKISENRELRREVALQLRDQGYAQAEAGKAVGVARRTVDAWENENITIVKNDNGYKPPDYRVKIPRTEDRVIYERHENGETQEQIAADYKVSQPVIHKRIARVKRQRSATRESPRDIPEGTFHLIHGDMFTVSFPTTADLILTDFPYNISGQGKVGKSGSEVINFTAGDWDEGFNTASAISLLASHLRSGGAFVFFADRLTISWAWEYCEHVGLKPKAVVVWHKTNPVPNARRNFSSATEFILWAVKPGSKYTWNGTATTHNLFECGLCQGKERIEWLNGNGEIERHPTQKPKELIAWLIRLFSNEGDIVLDPCAGVGSTGACGLNRDYWLIEKHRPYFDAMQRRLHG